MKFITENKTNQTNLWKVIYEIGSFKIKAKPILNEVKTNNGLTKDPEIIYDTLNNFFINVGKNLANSTEQVVMEPASLSKQSQINNLFFFVPAVPEEIILIFRNLKSKKAIREQDIDTKFLKSINQIISPFIYDLLNSYIEQDKFPTALKIAEVIPIFKKNDPNQATNYRPISLLSQLSKILEKVRFNRLYSYLEKYD